MWSEKYKLRYNFTPIIMAKIRNMDYCIFKVDAHKTTHIVQGHIQIKAYTHSIQ